MPVVVSPEGWVKVPPKPVKRSPKPTDPVGILRGPLAYITGRPEFKEPVKKRSINQLIHGNQLLIEAAAPPILQPLYEDKPRKPRNRVPSAPVSHRKNRAATEIFEEADEEIHRPDLRPDDSASRRSASPIGSRLGGAAPSVRSRRHDDDDDNRHRSSRSKGHKASQSVYNLEEEPVRTHRSRKHISSSHSVYSDDEPRHHHRSNRSERNYRDHGHSYSQSYAHLPSMPQIQPIVIYSTPPPAHGCGAHHHSCQSHTYQQHQCYAQPKGLIETNMPFPVPVSAAAALPAPAPPRSEVSARSSGSGTSRAMSYKWYTATQPLRM